MATTAFQGTPVSTNGDLPAVGSEAPDFTLVKQDLSELSLKEFRGKTVVLSVFPSADTSVCATSIRKFNTEAAALPDTVVLVISMDLPFAQARFCTAEGIENVTPLSAFRSPDFAQNYGLLMVDGPLRGLLARAVFVVGADGKVRYTQLVPEITQEPDYAAALDAAKNNR